MSIAAVIAGCANTNSSVVNVPAENQDVLVRFSIGTKALLTEASIDSEHDGNFEHALKMNGYSIFVNDEKRRTDVSLNDQLYMTAPANAIIHVIHKDSIKDLNAELVDTFSLTGSLRMESGLKDVVIPMENHDFGLITIEQSGYKHNTNCIF